MRGFKPALIGYIGNERIEFVPGKNYSIFVENLDHNSVITGKFEKFTDSFVFLNTETGSKLINFDTIYKVIEEM